MQVKKPEPEALAVQVLESDYEVQKSIAPYLQNRVLRRIIQTFTNDPANDMGKWAGNPSVLQMLQEAKRLMDGGYVTEDEMERLLIAQMQVP